MEMDNFGPSLSTYFVKIEELVFYCRLGRPGWAVSVKIFRQGASNASQKFLLVDPLFRSLSKITSFWSQFLPPCRWGCALYAFWTPWLRCQECFLYALIMLRFYLNMLALCHRSARIMLANGFLWRLLLIVWNSFEKKAGVTGIF